METTTKMHSNSMVKTGREILDLKMTSVPMLVDPIMPKKGVIALAGSSDLGKSYLLLQLSTSIIAGKTSFLGFNLKTTHKRVLYVSTEDDDFSLCPRLTNMTKALSDYKIMDNLIVIFATKNLLERIEKLLINAPADLVVIDTFSDIYDGDMNQTNKIRSFLQPFKELANRYNTLIMFNHHCGKKNDHKPPHKDNLLGSQGFESSMRMVVELRKDFGDLGKRHFCIVKGNYLPDDLKTSSYKLSFDFEKGFNFTGERVDFEELAKPDKSTPTDWKPKALELRKQGLSFVKIAEALSAQGFPVKKSTINNWFKKEHPSIQTTKENKLNGHSLESKGEMEAIREEIVNNILE